MQLGTGMLGLTMACAGAGPNSRGKDSRPNIVLMIADNLGMESVGLYGGSLYETPRIDSIGHEGITFDTCYIGTPLCSPARAGLMTGRANIRTGVFGQPSPGSPLKGGLSLDEITVAETLRAAGYRTACFGKWNLGYDPKFLPTHQGFDTYFGINAGHADYYTHIYDRDGKNWFYRDTTPVEPEGYVDNLCTDEAVNYIRERAQNGERFFLDVPFFTPHGPYQNPPGYPPVNDKMEAYANMIDNMDKQVGRILDTLKETGLDENTLVVFISDQGASTMNPYKRDLEEGGLKVVCCARWPKGIRPGIRSAEPVISFDLFPTFTNLGGGEVPTDRPIDGRDISGLFSGDGKTPHTALCWTHDAQEAIRCGDWKLHMESDKVRGLYNLSDDPKTERDLSSQYPTKVAELRGMYDDWRQHPERAPEWA